MGKFKKEQLHDIYGKNLACFAELAKVANEENIYLHLRITPKGDVVFSSSEYFSINGKVYRTAHEINQGIGHISENSETTKISKEA